MNRPFRKDRKGPLIVAAGWLFADMLLALAMLFLAANTLAIHPPPLPTRTPTLLTATSTPTPTPTPAPYLEQTFHRFKIAVDASGLLSGSQNARNAVAQQVEAQSFLQGRKAGLAIVYGGAPNDSQIVRAEDIANKVYDILHGLGKQNQTFTYISRYDPLYLLGGDSNTVFIDIFLFAQ
jgi:hypothetical protein